MNFRECIYVKYETIYTLINFVISGKLWNKAVELARVVSPDQVVQLEEQWGDSLVEKYVYFLVVSKCNV